MCLHGSDTIHYNKKSNLGFFVVKLSKKVLGLRTKILRWETLKVNHLQRQALPSKTFHFLIEHRKIISTKKNKPKI